MGKSKTVTTINQAIAIELVQEVSAPPASTHLYVGIDVAKNAHVAAFVSNPLLTKHTRYEKCPTVTFENSREGFNKLLTTIREYGTLDNCSVVVEQTGHYSYALQQFLLEQQITVYMLYTLMRSQAHAKTDRKDALAMANMLYMHCEKGIKVDDRTRRIRSVVAITDDVKKLQGLVHRRIELIQDMTRRKNKLTAIADELFPELTSVYANVNSASALALREQFPLPTDVAGASIEALAATRKGRMPGLAKLTTLRELGRQSIGTTSTHRQEALAYEQKQLIAELRLLGTHQIDLDEQIQAIIKENREAQILRSLGLGEIQAAYLLAYIGNIRKFDTPGKLRAFCGWAPEEEQTGMMMDRVKMVHGGIKSLKQMLYMFVIGRVRYETAWKVLYDRLVPRKCIYDERTQTYKGKMKVIGRIAGQIIGLIWRFLHEDALLVDSVQPGQELPSPKLYDEKIHREALQHAHEKKGEYKKAS